MGGMGDVNKVGKIEIEGNGEKKTKHDRTPRGTGRPQASRVGLKLPVRQKSTKSHKIARFLKQNRTRNTQEHVSERINS